jgi:D-2-hydroxyacid dehydrogenase (NADP+)
MTGPKSRPLFLFIRGAGLDVFHQEPLPKQSPLWKMDNVIISPHNGGFSSGQDIRELNVFKELYASYKERPPMPLLVDLEKRY